MASTPKTSASVGKHPLPNLRVGGFVGDACNDAAQCRPGLSCLGLFGDNQGVYPQGYCSALCPKDTCFDDAAYPYSRCVNWAHESEAICMIACNDQGRCDRLGYECGRADRSDGEGTRYICTPRPGSASNALQAVTADGVVTPPPGTTTIPAMVRRFNGTPAEFAAGRFAAPAAPLAAPPVEDTTAPKDGEPADPATALAQPSVAQPPEAGGPAPGENAQPRAVETVTSPASDVAFTPPRTADGLNPLSIGIIVVVVLITLFSLLRLLTSSRVGGVLRDIRTAADDETPLERIRREDRRKKVRSGGPDEQPEVRVQRRLPTRPLRGGGAQPGVEREDMPVMRRDDAVARQVPPPVSQPSRAGASDERAETPLTPRAPRPAAVSSTRDAGVGPSSKPPAPPAAEGPRAGMQETDAAQADALYARAQQLRADQRRADEAAAAAEQSESDTGPASVPLIGAKRPSIPSADGRRALAPDDTPQRPVDWMAPPNLENPLMDVGRPLATRLWAGARVARTQNIKRLERMDDHLPTLIEMDEFVPPLPVDMVMQLLDELLRYAEQMRQKKGYDAIVYIETDPRRTWFRRGPEGKIRIHHAPDAFAKPALATDSMRRKGFPASLRPPDAHMLSLVHLGRYLLGSSPHDEVMSSVDDLANTALRFSDEERSLVEFLLAPEENEHLRRVSEERRRGASRATEPSALASQSFRASQERAVPAPAASDMLPCPDCASEVTVGDLACRHCGSALHPRPAFCSACGTRNILLADGRSQQCITMSCREELVHSATHADVEGRRLSIIAELLSTFEEFRKIPSRGDQERYEARQQGRRVEVWQVPVDRGLVLVEDERPRYALGAQFTLPARSVERSGINFVVYDPPAEARHPLYSLGGEALAEQLLVLLTDVHDAKLRIPGLTVEDLSVSENGEVCLLHGHRLRVSTAPTPRMTDARFMAPELARQALATERSDLYTVAAIWFYATAGAMPGAAIDEDDAFMNVPDIIREMMKRALRLEPSDRPESARKMLLQLRGRRRIDDLV